MVNQQQVLLRFSMCFHFKHWFNM